MVILDMIEARNINIHVQDNFPLFETYQLEKLTITRHDPLRFRDDGQREEEIMTQSSQIVQQIHLARREHRDVQGLVGSSEKD